MTMTQTRPRPAVDACHRRPASCSGSCCPLDRDIDVLPLYVDTSRSRSRRATAGARRPRTCRGRCASRSPPAPSLHPDAILDRRRLRSTGGERISFGTYFNGSPPATGGAGPSSRGHASTSRSRRRRDGRSSTARWPTAARSGVDSAPPPRRGRRSTFDVRPVDLAPFVRRRLVLVRRRRRRRRTPWSRRPTWAADVPADRAEPGSVDHRHHHHEPAPTSAPSCSPRSARTTVLATLLDEVLVMEQGTQKVARRRALRRRRGGARRQAPGHRAGQHRRLRRLRPRAARDARGRPVDVRDVHGRRRRLRAREHRPRRHVRRPRPPPDDRRRPHVQPVSQRRGCTASARSSTGTASGGVAAARRDRLGLRRPQPAQRALAAPAHRRGLQRLVHVPDPDARCCARSG